MSNQIITEEFMKKMKMKTYGNQTISDNSLLDIGNGIILYPIEGNLIIFDCNINKEIKKIFLSFSLIKVIKKTEFNDLYLICCENGHIFILDINFEIINIFKPKEINNVYSLDISHVIKLENDKDKIYYYISICHHSIAKEDDIYYITHAKDAISLIQMEINFNSINSVINKINFDKIFTKPAFNVFSVFNYKEKSNDLDLISFYWDESNKYNVVKIYNINKENIINKEFNEKEIAIKEMTTEIKRYKKIAKNKQIVILCKKRNMHIFNLDNLNLDDSFKLEGVGEPGEYYVNEDNLNILMVNTTSQLINININTKINNREIPLNKNEPNLSEIILKDDFIRSMNWGLIEIKCKNGQNKIIIVNALGIKMYIKDEKNNTWIEDFYSSGILKMSGCGVCSLKNNIIAYGDLSGNLTIFDNNEEKYEQVKLNNEMVRSLCSDKDNNIIYVGTLSGKIFKYDYTSKKLDLMTTNQIDENNNNEAITCLKYLHPNLYFSDTGGNIFIYNILTSSIIYKYLPHAPQKDNTNLDFGSLSIKSEVWSFLVHEINNEYLYIITCSEDQSVKIWKIKLNQEKNLVLENKLIKEIKEHKFAVTCLDWTYIEKTQKDYLLTCSDDKTINIFDASNEKFEMILKTDFDKCIRGFFTLTYCSFSHEGKENDNLLCLGTQAGYIIIYDFIKKEIKFLEKIHYGGIEGVVFEKNIISTCGNDNVFNIIELIKQ